jgi:hypothetical protein
MTGIETFAPQVGRKGRAADAGVPLFETLPRIAPSGDTIRRNVVRMYRRHASRGNVTVAPIESWEVLIDAPRDSDTVIEKLYRRDSDGGLQRHGGRGTRFGGTVEASGRMVRLERVYGLHRANRADVEATMRVEPTGDGRAALALRAPSSVNGTEVRGSDRWQGSRRSSIRLLVAQPDGTIGRMRPDWRCYRVLPDGTREPLVSTATARQRKATVAQSRPTSRGTLGLAASLPRVEAD